MIILSKNKLTVRQLTESDASLLVKWLSDPKVLEFYEGRDRPHDMEAVRKHFYERTRGITQCIVQYDGQDIGYIQFYLITKEERQTYGLDSFEGKIFGMDQFIGETDYWNKGIGTELIRVVVTYLIEALGAQKIVMDPQTWNLRALRVYEKCGFVKKKLLAKHEWHEGEYRDAWLIEYSGLANG